jgi:hypothetical protein
MDEESGKSHLVERSESREENGDAAVLEKGAEEEVLKSVSV